MKQNEKENKIKKIDGKNAYVLDEVMNAAGDKVIYYSFVDGYATDVRTRVIARER